MSLEVELAAAIERAEEAERREEQFRTWWTGVSKQLDDLRRQYAQEDWSRAESCDEHGRKVKDLDAQVLRLQRSGHETEDARVTLVVGLQALQDLVTAHRAGQTRRDLTVDRLVDVVGSIVDRTLGGAKRPVKLEQLDLFGDAA